MSEVYCDGSILLDKISLDKIMPLFSRIYVDEFTLIKTILPKLPESFDVRLLDNTALLPNHIHSMIAYKVLNPLAEHKVQNVTKDSIKLLELLLKKKLELNRFFKIDTGKNKLLLIKNHYLTILNYDIIGNSISHAIPLLSKDFMQLEILKEFKTKLLRLKQFPIPESHEKSSDIIQKVRNSIDTIYEIYQKSYSLKDNFKEKIEYELFESIVFKNYQEHQFLTLYGFEFENFISLIWFIE